MYSMELGYGGKAQVTVEGVTTQCGDPVLPPYVSWPEKNRSLDVSPDPRHRKPECVRALP